MTKLRALYGALASGAICLTLGTATQAGEANYTVTGAMSEVSNSCVSPLLTFVNADCTYNRSAPLSGEWAGPVQFGRYYAPGNSPWQRNGVSNDAPPVPDPEGSARAITGTLKIDDQDTPCSGDDTIEGSLILEGGARTFSAGQGENAEEYWTTGTIVFDIPAGTVPTFQQANAGGCEYIIGGDGAGGFPEILTSANMNTFPADEIFVDSDNAPWTPGGGNETDTWNNPEPNGLGVGAREGATGIAISLNDDAFAGGTYECVDFTDNSYTGPTACATADADAQVAPCKTTSLNFCGDKRTYETWQIKIVVDVSGDIVAPAIIFADNDYRIFQPSDSWAAEVITFTAECDDCSLAKNDSYLFVTGTTGPVSLDIGFNDDAAGRLSKTDTTLTLDGDDAIAGNCAGGNTNFGPGDVVGFICDYNSPDNFAAAGTDTFTYTLNDGVVPAAAGLQATVTVEVQEDVAPVANPLTVELDSRGVDPVTLVATINVATDIPGNVGGNDPTTTASDPAPTLGTAQGDGAESITYTVTNGAAFLVKGTTDSFGYTITDANFGGTPETANSTITVQLAAADPEATDSVAGPVEAGTAVPFSAVVTLGNGSLAQHEADGVCDEGDVTITGISENGATVEVSGEFTAPEGFEGEAICEYTITDGEGDPATGEIVIDVKSGAVILLPGSGSAIAPWTLALLFSLPLLRLRETRRRATPTNTSNSGVK